MPFYNLSDETDYAGVAKANVEKVDTEFAAKYSAGLDRTPGSAILASVAAVPLDLLDTVASSVIPGVERQGINNAFLNAVGSPGLSKWYDDNRGAIELGSGIGGILLANAAANRILKPASFAMRAIRGVPYAKGIATLDSQAQRAIRLAQLTTREVGLRGMTGVERFRGVEMSLASLGSKPLVTSASRASRGVFGAISRKGLVQNLTTEGIMAATLHTNDMLYTDSLAHNIAWGAAGLGIGAGIDSAVGAYTLRKIANSDRLRRINQAAYDVTGVEAQRIHSMTIVDDILKRSGGSTDGFNFQFAGRGAESDKVTSLAISAAELQKVRSTTERGKSLFGKRESIANHYMAQAQEGLNKITTRGLTGLAKVGFGTKVEGLGRPLLESIERDPVFMHGIEEVGTVGEGLTREQTVLMRNRHVNERLTKVEESLATGGTWKSRTVKNKQGTFFNDTLTPFTDEEIEALRFEAKQLRFQASHVPVTMLEPGEWAPIELARVAEGYEPRAVVTEGRLGNGELKLWKRELKEGEENLGLDSNGQLFIPGNKRLETLDIQDMLGLYHVGNRAVRDMAAAGHTLQVQEKANWFTLDMAEQLLKATNNPESVRFAGSMTRESAKVESLAQKVDALRRKESAFKLASRRGSAERISETKTFEHKIFFNLPRISSYEQSLMGTSESTIDLLLGGLRSGDDVRKLSFDELLKMVNDAKKIEGFTEETKDTLDAVSGKSFNFLMDRDGVPIKPIIAMKRPLAPHQWTRDELFVRQGMKHALTRDVLLGESSDPITREITSILSSSPLFATARRIMELADDQQRSFIPGFRESAPQSATGSFMNAISLRARRDVDSEVMLAASALKQLEQRVTQDVMKRVIQGFMGDSITLVNSARAVESKLLLNQFHSFRQGWVLKREPKLATLPNGKKGFSFVLDETNAANLARHRQLFGGGDFAEGELLKNPNGTPIVVDELGLDVLQRSQKVHQAELAMKNTLLRSQGLQQISEVPWYAAAPNTKGKYMGFTFDIQDNVVPDMTIVANTPEELTRMGGELQASSQWKNGYSFRQKSSVESFMNLWDKAQMDFVQPNLTAIQSGKHNYGKTGSILLNTSAFDESLVTMRDNMVRHGSDLMEVLFDDTIKAAMSRAKLARVEAGVGEDAVRHSSIYDRYLQNLFGRSSLGASDSYFGPAAQWAETRLNGWLNSEVANRAGDTYQAVKDFIRTANPREPITGTKFTKLSQALGEYMPFKSAAEMLERETGSRTPKEVAKLTSQLSWFEAASKLRWLESMHAVATVGGILSNTPSIIRALQPRVGESLAEASARNGSLTMMLGDPNAKPMGVLNVPKLLWQSMRDGWSKVPDEFTTKAISRGMMNQEVAEFNRAWGSIDSKEGWKGFMFGNESASGTGVGAKVARSGGLDKWLGVLTDKAENFSRAWSMYAGRRAAQAMGIHNVDDQLQFADEIANKVIANYDPRNRPEIFQGALGAPIGLFQSYTYNFYSRMFRYAETKDAAALGTQYAMQAGVFGVASVPGWSALNWAFFDHGQGAGDDPVESIYKRFGTADGDLLMHGVLSNLPKIFGQDGISLYTRGDSQIRVPGANIPIADTIGRVMSGTYEGVKQLMSEHGLSVNQGAEILSNMMTNRPLAGMIEEFGAHGFDTSFDGQVVSQSRTAADSAYRILGVRSMSQQKEIENFYADKESQEGQNAVKTQLRSQSRAAIRDGRYDDLPGLFKTYVENGGSPDYYTRWVKSTFESALDSRGERLIGKSMKNENNPNVAAIGRLLDSRVDINADDLATDDYGRQQEIDNVIAQGWETNPDPTEPSPLDGATPQF